jgi:hypothetical protein
MIQPKQKVTSLFETREGEILTVPTLQTQSSDRAKTPPISPEQLQHDIFWRETVLFWNRSEYRWSLMEYVPCLMGIIWDEDRMGCIENLSSFPMEARYYFTSNADKTSITFTSLNYHRLFRLKLSTQQHLRRMSEPDFSGAGSRHFDPSGITQESFLFGRFLKHVLKSTKISCTVLILSLKLSQLFLRKIKSLHSGNYYVGLDTNQFRLFVTSLLLADKYSEDHPYTNKSWSSLSGLPIDEINRMEIVFLQVIGHELYISEMEFRNWTKSLQNLCQWNTPNPHHPENSRRMNFPLTSSIRRMSFSNSHVNASDASSQSTFSNSSMSHTEPEKVPFWKRFSFYRK